MSSLDDYYDRKYLRQGHVAHRVKGNVARCGQTPNLFEIWLGTGDQREYDKAARLPLCKRCDLGEPGSV